MTDPASRQSLISLLLSRRSRRFGRGTRLNGGPLAYESQQETRPLSLDDEAALAFAACGITNYVLGELPYQTGDTSDAGSGNILVNLIGRTIASGDAVHSSIVFVINDDGAWMLKRPQDFPRTEIPALIQSAHEHEFTKLYEKSRVRVSDQRLDVPRHLPFVPPFNKWSANVAGSTYFLPVSELTALYINMLLTAFDDEHAYFVMDERNNYQAAGIGKFAKSKGGHLHDDPHDNRFGTIGAVETWLCEFTAWEQGAMMQNLALMVEALGLGGFPHFAAYPYIWPQTLGFRMANIPLAKTIGANVFIKLGMRLLNKDVSMPTPLGLEVGGEVLIKPYCPPYYPNMQEAVLAFVDYKFGEGHGTLRNGGEHSAWRDAATVQKGIPHPSDRAIAATIAYADYVYQRYGRFPAISGPARTLLAYQAHHLDEDFYPKFYKSKFL